MKTICLITATSGNEYICEVEGARMRDTRTGKFFHPSAVKEKRVLGRVASTRERSKAINLQSQCEGYRDG